MGATQVKRVLVKNSASIPTSAGIKRQGIEEKRKTLLSQVHTGGVKKKREKETRITTTTVGKRFEASVFCCRNLYKAGSPGTSRLLLYSYVGGGISSADNRKKEKGAPETLIEILGVQSAVNLCYEKGLGREANRQSAQTELLPEQKKEPICRRVGAGGKAPQGRGRRMSLKITPPLDKN